MMATLDSNVTEAMVNNNQKEDPPSQDLANILKKSVLVNQIVLIVLSIFYKAITFVATNCMYLINIKQESYQQFCAIRETLIAEYVVVSPTSEPQKKGKRVKNPTVAEQDVAFSLPKDCDLASFKGIEEVLSKLEGWKIQTTQRSTGTFDTHYIHNGSIKKLRSTNEVVNYILPEGYKKLPKRKRSKGQRVKKAKKLKKTHTSKEQKENPEPSSASNEKVQDVQQTEEKKENLQPSNGSEAIIDLTLICK
ncbi:hypothetical protein TanjilG_25338 [Lupinus angustifolius]|uniref:Uncharacterized protein n=1 Tax=Lupinus angustifolius TaxID=3871 RepID=A0A4P1RVI5_LUPAN|nr:hypothetical protein TanjilG_25338 [Lupinus angustifolius]